MGVPLDQIKQLSPKDLYRLRRATCVAQRAQLRAELAQQNLKEIVLELERLYNLLGQEASLDIHTGRITRAASPNGNSEDLPLSDGEPQKMKRASLSSERDDVGP